MSRSGGAVREFQMHALKSQAVFGQGICWRRVLDLSWALTANFAIWMLLLQLPSVLRTLG
jgi:hypothetical protein